MVQQLHESQYQALTEIRKGEPSRYHKRMSKSRPGRFIGIPVATLQRGWGEPKKNTRTPRSHACFVLLERAGLPGYWTRLGPTEWGRAVHEWRGWSSNPSIRRRGRIIAPGLTESEHVLILFAWTVYCGSLILCVSDLSRLRPQDLSLVLELLPIMRNGELLSEWAEAHDRKATAEPPPCTSLPVREPAITVDLRETATVFELPDELELELLFVEHLLNPPPEIVEDLDEPVIICHGPFPPPRGARSGRYLGLSSNASEAFESWVASLLTPDRRATSFLRRGLSGLRMVPAAAISATVVDLLVGPGASRLLRNVEALSGRNLARRYIAVLRVNDAAPEPDGVGG